MSSRFTARYPRLLLPVVLVLAITACQKKPEPAEPTEVMPDLERHR